MGQVVGFEPPTLQDKKIVAITEAEVQIHLPGTFFYCSQLLHWNEFVLNKCRANPAAEI